jgi:uncharacterized membrane protein YdjX (TVP38/TMEM64 family)/rhodanese-related sulfurtransferase
MTRATFIRLALIALLLAAIAAGVVYRDQLDVAALEARITALGVVAPLAFMAFYAVAAVLFLPGSVLTLAGGALFGPVWGTLYSLTGATLGATLAFLVARHLAADWVTRKSGGRLKQLLEGVEQEGWRFVAFVRLVPLFPFNLLNYALGLTRIGLLPYVAATYVCMLPGAIAYTWLGYAGREAAAGAEGTIQKVLIALALLALAVFLPRLVKRLRGGDVPQKISAAELRVALATDRGMPVLDVRTAQDYDGELGHIPGALNIPLDQLPARLAELGALRDHPFAVICRTNRMSGQAVQMLSAAGFKSPLLVADGMMGWSKNAPEPLSKPR